MTVEILAALSADTAGHTSTTEAVLFWVLGTVAVIGAIGVVAAPKAVYSAMFLATTMIVLAIFYIPLFFVLVRRGVRDGLAKLRHKPTKEAEA